MNRSRIGQVWLWHKPIPKINCILLHRAYSKAKAQNYCVHRLKIMPFGRLGTSTGGWTGSEGISSAAGGGTGSACVPLGEPAGGLFLGASGVATPRIFFMIASTRGRLIRVETLLIFAISNFNSCAGPIFFNTSIEVFGGKFANSLDQSESESELIGNWSSLSGWGHFSVRPCFSRMCSCTNRLLVNLPTLLILKTFTYL